MKNKLQNLRCANTCQPNLAKSKRAKSKRANIIAQPSTHQTRPYPLYPASGNHLIDCRPEDGCRLLGYGAGFI